MSFEFVPKPNEPKPGIAVGTILGKTPVTGDVGIEIEVEGKRLLYEDTVPSPWVFHNDNSLRGHENAEYVLKKPIDFNKVPDALNVLFKALKKNKAVLDDSNRTSVHVHLNCQKWHLNRLAAFLGLYFTLEEILTEWCGEERVGNLFCLRAKDAEAIVGWIKRFIKSDGTSPIPDTLRYGNLNANSLFKYGSLEIRSLRGTSDPKVIEEWVEILERLYKISADFPDPRQVCALVSGTGPLNFFETILGAKAEIIRKGIPYTDHDIANSIYQGVRLAQDICYCRDWELYKPIPLKADPFDRNMKKVVSNILNTNQAPSVYSGFSASTPVTFAGNIVIPVDVEPEYVEDEEPEYDDEEIYDDDNNVPYSSI